MQYTMPHIRESSLWPSAEKAKKACGEGTSLDLPYGGLTVLRDKAAITKGLMGDVLATVLGAHDSFAVDAAGDVRFGGAGSRLRPIRVASPFDVMEPTRAIRPRRS